MHSFFYAASVLVSTFAFANAHGFDASSNTNVAMYWGQGSNQKPLRHFCDEESIDIIPIGFVNVFPDQEGANGYPGTNFGNACGGSYYKSPDGKETRLLESCPLIASDIKYCQAQGKKVLLSLGGGSPDVYLASDSSAKDMADFLWGAFGPAKEDWEGPRPFGDASIDGFDLDIESEADKIVGPVDFGYATLVDRLRHLYDQEEATYYISASPQCIIPDSHLSDAISKSIFDFIFVHFYNTPSCSARAGIDHSYGAYGGPATDISYDSWVDHVKTKSANKEAKIYMGLAAAATATFGDMYLSPEEAVQLVEKFQSKWPTMFGGVMLWEATFSENNQYNGMSYGKHIKMGLESCSCASKPSNTSSVVTSSTVSSTSAPTVSTSSSAEYPTSSTSDYPTSSSTNYFTSNSTASPSSQISPSSSSLESSSTTSSTTYNNLTMSSTTTTSATASPSSCGVKGFDKSPAYNFLNDTISANFEKCSARCIADAACVSFGFGMTQCLLYTQTVASNVNETPNSPFTFYDKSCGTPSTSSSSMSSSTSSVVSSSRTSSANMTSSSYESHSTVSETISSKVNASSQTNSHLSTSSLMTESLSSSVPYPTGPKNITSSGYAYPTGSKDNTSGHNSTPTSSETIVSSSYLVSTSSTSEEYSVITSTPTYSSSETPDEDSDTVTSYVDVTVTSCPPDVTACPTKSNGGSPTVLTSSSSPVYPDSSSSSPSSVLTGSIASSISSRLSSPVTSEAATRSSGASTSSPSSLSSAVTGPAGSSSSRVPSYPVTSGVPSQSSKAPEGYTTIITTHYIGICPTGYTTIPYTTTVVIPSSSGFAHAPSSGLPAGFTTTVAVCPACNSASPTVTLTIPVISVIPIPAKTDSPSAGSPPVGYTSAGFPSAASSPAAYSSTVSQSAGSPVAGSPSVGSPSASHSSVVYPSAGSPPASSWPAGYPSVGSSSAGPSSTGSRAGGSNPAGYAPSAPATQISSAVPTGYAASHAASPKSSAAPVTDLAPKPSAQSPAHSGPAPTMATPPYSAGNSTSSFKTAPASAGSSKTSGASTGLSGAEATRPAAYTGSASTASEGSFVAVVVAAIWAGLLIV